MQLHSIVYLGMYEDSMFFSKITDGIIETREIFRVVNFKFKLYHAITAENGLVYRENGLFLRKIYKSEC